MALLEDLWKWLEKPQVEYAVLRLKRLKESLAKKYPGVWDGGLKPYAEKADRLLAKYDRFLKKEWDKLSRSQIEQRSAQLRKETLDLAKEFGEQEKLAKQDMRAAKQDMRAAKQDMRAAKQDMRAAKQDMRAAKQLEKDYISWRKRLNSLRKESGERISANREQKLSPTLEIKRDRLLEEQEKLIERGKKLGVEPVFDSDGWLTG
jgi:hypothetical protein